MRRYISEVIARYLDRFWCNRGESARHQQDPKCTSQPSPLFLHGGNSYRKDPSNGRKGSISDMAIEHYEWRSVTVHLGQFYTAGNHLLTLVEDAYLSSIELHRTRKNRGLIMSITAIESIVV